MPPTVPKTNEILHKNRVKKISKKNRQKYKKWINKQRKKKPNSKNSANTSTTNLKPTANSSSPTPGPSTSGGKTASTETNSNLEQKWQKNYETNVRWHLEHRYSYLKNLANNLKKENEKLKRQIRVKNNENNIAEKDNLDEEDADDDNDSATDDERKKDSDSEFVDFLEITARHRIENQMKKNQADDDNDDENEGEEGNGE